MVLRCTQATDYKKEPTETVRTQICATRKLTSLEYVWSFLRTILVARVRRDDITNYNCHRDCASVTGFQVLAQGLNVFIPKLLPLHSTSFVEGEVRSNGCLKLKPRVPQSYRTKFVANQGDVMLAEGFCH
jgi:hypothetical protein